MEEEEDCRDPPLNLKSSQLEQRVSKFKSTQYRHKPPHKVFILEKAGRASPAASSQAECSQVEVSVLAMKTAAQTTAN